MGVDGRVTVEVATAQDKPVLRRLLELMAYELSAFDGRDIGPHGEYGYPYLDHYWDGSRDRAPFLFRVDGHLAGFALLRQGPPHQVAEFLVLPSHRRGGVGTAAARLLFARWSGRWTVHELPGNAAAVAFWRRAIPVPFAETDGPDGTTQHFELSHQG